MAPDASLRILRQLRAGPNAAGHLPTVADLDGDGRGEVVPGTLVIDDDGAVLWRAEGPSGTGGRLFHWIQAAHQQQPLQLHGAGPEFPQAGEILQLSAEVRTLSGQKRQKTEFAGAVAGGDQVE